MKKERGEAAPKYLLLPPVLGFRGMTMTRRKKESENTDERD